MTGSLRAFREPPPRRRHDHVDIVLDGGTTLRYHDPRRFGAVLCAAAPVERHPLLASLGPEPFDAGFDAGYLAGVTKRRRAAIKLALMDNHLVVGVGNIYANESLFRAGIRPTIGAHRVARHRLARLVDEVRSTLSDAIAKGGSTLRDYVDSDGAPGYFQLDYFVYGRGGAALPRLRHADPGAAPGRPGQLLLPDAASADDRGGARRRDWHGPCLRDEARLANVMNSDPPARAPPRPANSPRASKPTRTGAGALPGASPACTAG